MNMSFNVYTFHDHEGCARYPSYLSRENPDTAVDLLFCDGHYAWINSLTRILDDQIPNGHERF
jgi:hypothetical protein